MDKTGIVAWLKALVLLVVVLGSSWIVGVAVTRVELAYIYTILVAFQGLAIFLSLVIFQKSVRDEYIKCCLKRKRKGLVSKYTNSSVVASSPIKVTYLGGNGKLAL